MDRLVEFVEQFYKEQDDDFKCGVKVAGLMLHMLLFADDIVLMSASVEGLQKLLDAV
jgi:hypothetical protein